MNKIEEMIKKLCPNGVEYKEIQDICINISTGLNPRNNFRLNQDNANNYYVTVKEITTGRIVFTEKTDKINDDAVNIIQARSKLEKDDVLLSGIGTIGKVALVDIDINNWNCSESIILLKVNKNILYPKYLKYVLETQDIQAYFIKNSRGSTLKGIRQQDLKILKIPVPPIAVQQEIVKVLDTFSELTAELTAELAARKKQYAYYKHKLLSFENLIDLSPNGVEYKALWEITYWDKKFKGIEREKQTKVLKFKHILAAQLKALEDKNGDVKLLATGYYDGFTTSEKASEFINEGEVITIPSGGYANIKYYSGKFVDSGNILASSIDCKKYNLKYIYHILLKKNEYIQSLYRGGSVQHPDMIKLLDMKIPVPPLEVQEYIVNILDKFDSLVNDIMVGLPAEIAARQKQYAYYRDKLLTFASLK